MTDSMNYIFDEVVGGVRCKFDGRLWSFEDNDLDLNMIVPVKSISNVALLKKRSWGWLVVLLVGLFALYAGRYEDDVRLYIVAGVFGIAAIVWLIFSVTYMVSVIPHSGNGQKIVTRHKKKLTNLHEALMDSLRKNF